MEINTSLIYATNSNSEVPLLTQICRRFVSPNKLGRVGKSTINWAVFLLVVFGVGFYMNGGITGNAVAQGGSQEFIISMENWKYSPDTIRVKAGSIVSLGLDASVQGCFRDLVLPEMGLKKYLASTSDRLVFTAPMKKGRYTFACSMNMGTGTIIVE